MKHFIPLLLVVSLCSCKKDSTEQSRTDLIIGSWTAKQYAVDENSNGTKDDSEIKQYNNVNPPATFKTVGTARIGYPDVLNNLHYVNYKWKLLDNDQTLQLTNSDNGYVETVTIDELSSSTLILKYAGPNAAWTIYNKN
jgi:hypothetical protein